MSKPFRTLDDADVSGKRVLLRVDLNVPTENGRVTDTTRIERVASTIEEIAAKGGKVILLAHFGRPKGGPDEANSLRPVAAAVADIVKRPVAFSHLSGIVTVLFLAVDRRGNARTEPAGRPVGRIQAGAVELVVKLERPVAGHAGRHWRRPG